MSSGHWSFCLQLHPFFGVVLLLRIFLLWFLNDAAHVRHATVANFHVVLVEDGVEIVVWWEVFLYGGLNQMVFLFLFLFVGADVFFLQ